ncbi:MAG: hypothetical protein AABX29_08040 [Nanoarchaeota archaeon]
MKKSIWVIILILALGIFGYYGITAFVIKGNTLSSEFGQCLIDNKAIMYGSATCIHCQSQKELLGRKATQILYDNQGYIECPENQKLCESKAITGYPTWIINGTKYEGVQSIELLSSITGCEPSYE